MRSATRTMKAGTFNVHEYRAAMPTWVKLHVLIYTMSFESFSHEDAKLIQFDHDPALTNRDYDLDAGDFIPPQNDPDYIVARLKADHLEKTTGRKAGAAKTVTTRSSDVGERSRSINIRDTSRLHEAKMALKAGDRKLARKLLREVQRKTRLRRKRKIQSPGFPKQQRPFPRRK